VNPYAASTFYAVDRFCSYKQKWQKFYEEGGILVADRYTTSNAIHQGVSFQERISVCFLNGCMILSSTRSACRSLTALFFWTCRPVCPESLWIIAPIKPQGRRKKIFMNGMPVIRRLAIVPLWMRHSFTDGSGFPV
jgi:dTMP kinase